MQCVILAGGIATRMRPLTEKIPKALLPIGETPFLHYQLTWLKNHGVDRVLLSVGYLGEMIESFAGDGSRWGLNIQYAREGKDLRGTAGALRLALDEGLLEKKFLVTWGDSFLPVDFGKIAGAFDGQPFQALMTVFHNQGKWDTSNVWFENGKILAYDKRRQFHPEKLEYIDYGLMAFHRALISQIPAGEKVDLADVLGPLSLQGKLAGYEVFERFYEIGSPSGLTEFRQSVDKYFGGRRSEL